MDASAGTSKDGEVNRMHESKRDGYIRRIGIALSNDDVKAGISLTHEAAQEILELLKQPWRSKGKWNVDEDGNSHCPFCGSSGFDNFCSTCGADMRG